MRVGQAESRELFTSVGRQNAHRVYRLNDFSSLPPQAKVSHTGGTASCGDCPRLCAVKQGSGELVWLDRASAWGVE